MTSATYIGIDLGTSNSAIVGYRDGRLELYKAVSGEDVLPSVVMCDRHGSRYVGKRAYDQLRTSPNGIAARFKRLLGTDTALPFGGADATITPQQASTDVLRQLLKQMRAAVGDVEVAGAVVTVPAAFNQMQSEATLRAAEAAGLAPVGLLQEPIAAALACLEKPETQSGLFLVYDLGGGTFDVALVRAIDGAVTIEAHEGVNMLGGSDFDRMLVDAVVKPWLTETFALPIGWQTSSDYRRLLALATSHAEAAKIELSTATQAMIFVPEHDARLSDAEGRAIYIEALVTRADVEGLVSEKIEQSIALCRKVIADHGYTTDDVERVVLIGGPSRMPIVRERVPGALGVAASLDVDPMTAVARGAAIFAESRDWGDGKAQTKPSRVQQSVGANVSFDYEARTARDRARIRVTAVDGGAGLRVSAAASDGRDYGERNVADSPVFVVELGSVQTIVRMTVTDALGARIEGACAELAITRVTAAAAGAPCTSTIAVKVEEGDSTRAVNVLEPLIRKGQTLPLKGAKTLRAARRLAPGSIESIDIELFEQAEGVEEPEANLLIGAFRLSGEDLPSYATPLRPGEQVVLHWAVDDSQIIRCSVELPEQGLHLRDHCFYVDDLARIDFAANGRAFALQLLAGTERALETFDRLGSSVRVAFATEIGRLRVGLAEQFRRLREAIDAELLRSIAEEARLLRQEASRLKHRPKLRQHVIEAELSCIEAEMRELTAVLSLSERDNFARHRTRLEEALAGRCFTVAERASEAMRGILSAAYRRRPEYAAELFRWLQGRRALSNDPPRFDALVARGRDAAMNGNEAELRHVCGAIARTLDLPTYREADVAGLAGLRR